MSLHKVPDSRTGKGVSVQYVPYKRPPIRGRQSAESDREAGQNLVSEPENEDEEDEQRKDRQQRPIMWTTVTKQPTITTSLMDSTDVPKHTTSAPLLLIFITFVGFFCINLNFHTV